MFDPYCPALLQYKNTVISNEDVFFPFVQLLKVPCILQFCKVLGIPRQTHQGLHPVMWCWPDTPGVSWSCRELCWVPAAPWLNRDTCLAMTSYFEGLSNCARRSSGMGICSCSYLYVMGPQKAASSGYTHSLQKLCLHYKYVSQQFLTWATKFKCAIHPCCI